MPRPGDPDPGLRSWAYDVRLVGGAPSVVNADVDFVYARRGDEFHFREGGRCRGRSLELELRAVFVTTREDLIGRENGSAARDALRRFEHDARPGLDDDDVSSAALEEAGA